MLLACVGAHGSVHGLDLGVSLLPNRSLLAATQLLRLNGAVLGPVGCADATHSVTLDFLRQRWYGAPPVWLKPVPMGCSMNSMPYKRFQLPGLGRSVRSSSFTPELKHEMWQVSQKYVPDVQAFFKYIGTCLDEPSNPP